MITNRALCALLFALAACGGGETAAPSPVQGDVAPTATTPSTDVVRLARAARGLAAATDDAGAAAALQAEGYTVETYEAVLYDVAADPAQSAAFQAARK